MTMHDRVDLEWAMRLGWASAPVLAAILEQRGGSIGIDPLDIERHLRDGTTPRFEVENSARRLIAARLPEPAEPPGPLWIRDPCPVCGHAVVWIKGFYAQPCNHRVQAELHDNGEVKRLVLTALPDRDDRSARGRARRGR